MFKKGPHKCLYINCYVSPDPSSATPKTFSAMKTLDPQNPKPHGTNGYCTSRRNGCECTRLDGPRTASKHGLL